MSNVTSSLTVRLTDDVSGPAGKAAGALHRLGASGKDLAKLAAASPETARLVRELERLKALSGKIDTFKGASRGLDELGVGLRKARQDIAQAEKLVARHQAKHDAFFARKRDDRAGFDARGYGQYEAAYVSRLEKSKRALAKAQKALPGAEADFKEQGRHVRGLRNELTGAGVAIGSLRSVEGGLRKEIEATNAAIAKQPALLAEAEARATALAQATRGQLQAAVEAGKAERAAREAAAARAAQVARAKAAGEAGRPGAAAAAAARIADARAEREAARAKRDPILNPERGQADLRKAPELAKAIADRAKLQGDAGKIEDFRVESRGLKEASTAFRLAQQDVRKLKAELASATGPTDAIAARLAQAHAAAASAGEAFRAQGQAVRAARAALGEAGISVDRLRTSEAALAGSINQATAALQRQTAELGKNKEAQARAAERATQRRDAAGQLAAGAGVIAAYKGKEIGKKAIVSAAEFDIGVRKQRAFTDINEAQQAPLIEQAKKIGQETQFSNLDVVKAQTKAMQGLPAGFGPELKAQVAAGVLENVRNYATVMEADLETSAEAIRSYLQQTNKDISTKEKALSESNKATNQLVKMAKLGGMSDEDVQQYMKFAAAPGTSAGLSSETLMSLAALARRGGLRGDEAGTFIRATSGKLVSPTKKGLAALNAAGINFNDYVGMPDKLETSALENQFRMDMGKSFTPAIRKKLDAINSNKELLGDRGKYTEAVANAVGPILGQTKKGKVKAADARTAAKTIGDFHKVSASSVDTERLLDDAMSKNMTLPQLNAWLTDKHGGKGAITQRQWDEFKVARGEIKKTGDDPNFAADKAKLIMGGLGGSFENLKGSVDNLITTMGTANAGLLKWSFDNLGAMLDQYSKLPEAGQRAVGIGAGVAATAGGVWGTAKLMGLLLGGGGSAAALTGSAAALDGSAAALTAAAARLGVAAGVPAAAAPAAAAATTGAATVGGFLTGGIIGGFGLAGAYFDSNLGGNTGALGQLAGQEPDSVKATRWLREQREAEATMQGAGVPASWSTGPARALPEAADPRLGFPSAVEVSRGMLGDFLLGKGKATFTLPQAQAVARAAPAPGVTASQAAPAAAAGQAAPGVTASQAAPAAAAGQAAPGVTASQAAPAAAAGQAASSPQSLALPPAPDAAKIFEATSALAGYRTELAAIKAEMEATSGLDLPGVGSGLEARKAELEGLISGVQAKLQALGAETVTPHVDGSALDGIGVKSDEAQAKLSALGATSVAPTVDSGSIDALLSKINQAISGLSRLGGAVASANASIGRVNAAAAAPASVAGAGQSSGRVRQALNGSYSNGTG